MNLHPFILKKNIGNVHLTGTHISSFVLLAESTLPTFTNTAVTILKLIWPCGQLIVALAAYNLRDEFHLQLALYCPLVLTWALWLLLQESTRWLLAKGVHAISDDLNSEFCTN